MEIRYTYIYVPKQKPLDIKEVSGDEYVGLAAINLPEEEIIFLVLAQRSMEQIRTDFEKYFKAHPEDKRTFIYVCKKFDRIICSKNKLL